MERNNTGTVLNDISIVMLFTSLILGGDMKCQELFNTAKIANNQKTVTVQIGIETKGKKDLIHN